MTTAAEPVFDNSFLRLPGALFAEQQPKPLPEPHLVSFNTRVAAKLGLNACDWPADKIAQIFSGNQLLEGMVPLAMKYTGHQFGVYNPDLGDGRGLLLGETLSPQGERFDWHLKGAGQTPFSRFGDGRAVLRSSIREYLVSEAMFGLGVPTTEALSLVGSSEYARREMMEPCAALLRVSRCHIRFGHFEYAYYTGQTELLKTLADYAIERFFPECAATSNPYLEMFEQVLQRSASLVAKWQSLGFVHGVMNSDNMSLIGETFDYGPYSFMDNYLPRFVSSHTDTQGRYAFERQPKIMHWNLACLAQALTPLVEQQQLVDAIESYPERYQGYYWAEISRKLGWLERQPEDIPLMMDLEQLFASERVDIHRFYRALGDWLAETADADEPTQLGSYQSLVALGGAHGRLPDWLARFLLRSRQETDLAEQSQRMAAINPRYVLRNYMAEEAIRAAHSGDFTLVNQLLGILRNPCVENPDLAHYEGAPPDWAAGISLSCSS